MNNDDDDLQPDALLHNNEQNKSDDFIIQFVFVFVDGLLKDLI